MYSLLAIISVSFLSGESFIFLVNGPFCPRGVVSLLNNPEIIKLGPDLPRRVRALRRLGLLHGPNAQNIIDIDLMTASCASQANLQYTQNGSVRGAFLLLNEPPAVLNRIQKLGSDFLNLHAKLFRNPEFLTAHPTRLYFSTCSLWALHIGLLYWHDHIVNSAPISNSKQYIKALHRWFNLIDTSSLHLQM
jgi:hypothetical protein